MFAVLLLLASGFASSALEKLERILAEALEEDGESEKMARNALWEIMTDRSRNNMANYFRNQADLEETLARDAERQAAEFQASAQLPTVGTLRRNVCPVGYVEWNRDMSNEAEISSTTTSNSGACAVECNNHANCRGYEWNYYEYRSNSVGQCKIKRGYNKSTSSNQHWAWVSCIKIYEVEDCIRGGGPGGSSCRQIPSDRLRTIHNPPSNCRCEDCRTNPCRRWGSGSSSCRRYHFAEGGNDCLLPLAG